MLTIAARWFAIYLVVFAMRSALLVALASGLSRLRSWQARRVYRKATSRALLRRALRAAAMIVLLDAAAFAAVRTLGLIREAPDTPGNTAITFAAMFVVLEIWFYASHRLLHTRALMPFHAEHHRSKVTHPLAALTFHPLERVVLMGGGAVLAIALSRVLPLTFDGLLLYFSVNYALTIVGHLNVELTPVGFPSTALGRVGFTATYHAMHHARGTRHFGLFTRFLDRAFATEWDDYDGVHARAAGGAGFSSFAERAPVRADEWHR